MLQNVALFTLFVSVFLMFVWGPLPLVLQADAWIVCSTTSGSKYATVLSVDPQKGSDSYVALYSGQVLVLYHEMMPQQEMTDYFSRLLYPIIPLAVVGRSWAAQPVCERETAVYWNWKAALTIHEQIILFLCFPDPIGHTDPSPLQFSALYLDRVSVHAANMFGLNPRGNRTQQLDQPLAQNCISAEGSVGDGVSTKLF